MVLIASISSERTSVKRRASCAIRRAYASAPIRVACIRPAPATTKLPDRDSSPRRFATGSDSPVNSDSSSSKPSDVRTTPSAGT
jgi:hypothetical protein